MVTGGGEVVADNAEIESLLPAPGFSQEWVIDGKVKHYNSDNLYVYINGEAELFIPYGFKTLASAFYIKGDDAQSGLAADVYMMGSELDAFGIYSNFRDVGAEQLRIGTEGFISDSQLMFFKDRYFIRLSVSGTVTGERDLLLALARAISEKIPGGSLHPNAVRIIDIPGIVPGSIKYIAQSVLGYAFFRKGLTADLNIDSEFAKVFVILNKSYEESYASLQSYITYLREAKANIEKNTRGEDATFLVQDPLYRGTAIRQAGACLIGVTKLRDLYKGIAVIDQIEANGNSTQQ